MTPVYESKAKLVIIPVTDNFLNYDEVRASISSLDKDHIANTYAEVSQSSSVVNIAYDNLGFDSEGYQVVSDVLAGTSIITVAVQGPEAERTRNLAQEVAKETEAYVSENFAVYGIEILDDAHLPEDPERPNVLLNIVLGVVLGIAAGVVIAFLGEFINDSLASLRKSRAPFFT
jgi:capsular polysaccharide biosynthesis protein